MVFSDQPDLEEGFLKPEAWPPLNQLFFMMGLSRTTAVHSVLIISMMPIFVLSIAALIGQERITPIEVMGREVIPAVADL